MELIEVTATEAQPRGAQELLQQKSGTGGTCADCTKTDCSRRKDLSNAIDILEMSVCVDMKVYPARGRFCASKENQLAFPYFSK